MERILMLNASPRAPRSNSKQYAALFAAACPAETTLRNVSPGNHQELCRLLEHYSQLLLVFPLYADGIPVSLLTFLKTLENHSPQRKPVISVLVNCGFLEPAQNDVAVGMVQLFCRENGYPFGSVLKIGSGEAILATPFQWLVRRKIRQLSRSILEGQNRSLSVTMPLSKGLFLMASTVYWTRYGRRNGISREQMATMEIEGKP